MNENNECVHLGVLFKMRIELDEKWLKKLKWTVKCVGRNNN